MLTPEQNTELKAKIGTLIDTYTEVVEPPPPPPPPPPDDTTPHPDDPTKHDEHVAAMAVTPVEGTTIIVKAGETFTLDKQILNLQPRAVPRDKVNDPLDFSGGIVSHGTVSITGTPKLVKAVPVAPIKAGDTVLTFAVPLDGWQVGDELLIPGDARGETEHPTIAAIDDSSVTLSAPAAFNHGDLYRGKGVSRTPAPPVCNMTRDAGVHGPVGVSVAERPHLMFMHSQAVNLSHASFKNLGRTDAARMHTLPQLDEAGQVIPGTDDNTMGRYSVHKHDRVGAKWANTPVEMTGLAIDGTPKHGLVNHGGFVIAKDNAVTNWSGSALFTENGSEIGGFVGNVTAGSVSKGVIHSPNSRQAKHTPTPPETRPTPEDHGFAEYGVWLQGGGVPLIDHYSADCQVGMEYFPNTLYDSSPRPSTSPFTYSEFLVENLFPPEQYLFGRPLEPLQVFKAELDRRGITDSFNPFMSHPAYFKGCRAVGCDVGLGCWATESIGGMTVIEDFEAIHCGKGIEFIYHRNSLVLGARLIRQDPATGYTPSSTGIAANVVTRDIWIYDLIIEGYDYPHYLPFFGNNKVIRAHYDSRFGPFVFAPAGGSLEMRDITFGGSINDPLADKILLTNEMDLDERISTHAFDPYTLTVDGVEIIHNCRLPNFIPFPDAAKTPASLQHVVGKTNRQLFDEFGLWVGGREIPDVELVPHPLIYGGGVLN